jgi:hypothetical protein
MKTSLGNLRRLIREVIIKEASDDVVYKPELELEELIGAMAPDDISPVDYVDVDTGEIYLEKGKPARTSKFHPQHGEDRATLRAAKQAKLDADEAEWAKRDAEFEAEEERIKAGYVAAYEAAVKEFAAGATDSVRDNPDVDPSDIATDMADNFFYNYISWKTWARVLGISKEEMKSAVSEACYEAMINGQ